MNNPSYPSAFHSATAITAEDSTLPPRLRASARTSPLLSSISDLRSPARSASVLGHGAASAFTLIELLVVVTVIGILAGLTLAAMSGVQEKSARDKTRAEIAAISNAIEQYRNINDSYPPSGAANLYTNIARFFETQISQTNAGQLVDPYGNPYQYSTNRPGMKNPASFDLWSTGKNAAATNDDIGNW